MGKHFEPYLKKKKNYALLNFFWILLKKIWTLLIGGPRRRPQ
jgi:hypothetical protein